MIYLILFIIRLIIEVALIVGIILLAAYLLLGTGFDIVSRFFDASYKYNSNDFNGKKRITIQKNEYEFHFDTETNRYWIEFGENRSLVNGKIKIYVDKTFYASIPEENEKRLILKECNSKNGENKLGKFNLIKIKWQLEGREDEILTNFYLFIENNFIIFELVSPKELKNLKRGKFKNPVSHFPCFENQSPNKRILSYQNGIFFPPTRKLGSNMAPAMFYDDKTNLFVLTSMNNFLISYVHQDKKTNNISGCLNGELESIPEAYSQKFLLYFGKGINNSFKVVGDILLKSLNGKRKSPYDCECVKYLGYWTNNGACYYYRPESGLNYTETMVKLNEYIESEGIPIKYIQLDSWWYKKASSVLYRALYFLKVNGCYLWEPREEVFPEGMKYIQEKVKKPFVCHARWFDGTSPYVKKYNFELNDAFFQWSLPDSQEFWDNLMAESKAWGLTTYEQDWLNNQYNNFKSCRSDVERGRRWLYQMAKAAEKKGITVQYCMANPGMIMHSMEFTSVTHARTSNDYNSRMPKTFYFPCFTQSNMLLNMVGIWPFKDNFASTTGPNIFYREKFPIIETLLSSLSGGVIGPSDKIGYINKDLLMKTCRSDGILLKPDRAITPIDLMFLPNRKYYINTTESVKNSNQWTYILVINLWPRRVKDRSFTLKDLHVQNDCILYDFHKKRLQKITSDDKIEQNLKKNYHKYYIAAPLFNSKISFIGTPEKFVTCSNFQFPNVNFQNDELSINIFDLIGKELPLLFYSDEKPSVRKVEGAEIIEENYQELTKKYILTIKMIKKEAEVIVKY